MTVASNTPYDQYTATSGQTVFNYTFEIVEQTDLLVYQTPAGDDPDDTAQLLTVVVDYSVTGVGNENGGTIVLGTGATLNDIITIKQNVPVARDTAFTPGGVLRADDLNLEFDNQTLIEQVTRFNEQSRMLRYWDSAIVTDLVDNIIPVLGANQIWAMNPAGDQIIVYDVPEGGGLAPSTATYLLQVANSELPNAQAMGVLASGLVVSTITTGVQLTRVLDGTADQLGVTDGDGIGGNPTYYIVDNPIIPGTAGMGIPQGTTAERVEPVSGIGLRFNTDIGSLEYWDGVAWVQLEDSTDLATILALLASHTAGEGAALIGLEDQSGVTSKTVQDMANAPFVAKTDDGTLQNAQFLDALGAGMMFNALDGTLSVLTGSSAITAIINDDTMATAAATNIPTALSIKNYVDSVAAGFTLINPVRVASTANLVATYSNGASGIGATLTVTALGVASIDGVALSLNDRVLFKNQSTTFQNGIYYVSDIGSGGTSAVYTRATDFDQPSEIDPGDLVPVLAGSTQTGTLWLQTATVTTIGTDPITFIQFAAAYTNVVTLDGIQTVTGQKTFVAPILGAASATSISFTSTSGIIGTTTNDNAAAGSVGEYVSSNIPLASAINIANNTATNLSSISLTAGDWLVGGNIRIAGTAQAVTRTIVWLSTTSATFPDFSNINEWNGNTTTFVTYGGAAPMQRISISGTTTVYISGQITFASGTASICGNIWARRLR
jgi:hypothetical protein